MRKYILSLLLILLLSSWAGKLASRAATADALTPAGTMQMPFIIANGNFALWSGSAFVFVKDRFSSAPLFQFFDRNGTQVSEYMFSIPGVSYINIYDNSVALGLDGSLAIVGTAYFDDSKGGMFVAWVSPDRQEQTIMRTNPFFPAAVTLATDGTIWVAGHDTKPQNEERDYSQHLIRRYDKTGKLLGSFIPWSTLGTDLPFNSSVLLPIKDHVGWYSPRSHAYIEFSSDGSVVNRFKSAPHPDNDLTFGAVCDDGGLFVGDSRPNGPHQTASWGIYTLDRQRGEWSLIPRDEKWGMLFGCDGTRLATTTDFRTMSWLQPTGN
jgi:hypothetical protein